MKKLIMSGVCLIFLSLLLAAGCGQREDRQATGSINSSGGTNSSAGSDGEEYVLTLFDKNSDRHSFDDRIAQEIMRRTGVRIQVIDSTDDAAEKEELMYTYPLIFPGFRLWRKCTETC